jgi:hypothetical protein
MNTAVAYLQREVRKKRRGLKSATIDEKMLLLHDIKELQRHIEIIKLL